MKPFLPVVLAAALSVWGVHAGQRDQQLDLYWIDSQGGGSTLIVTPAGESILIDSGNPGGRDSGRIHAVLTQQAGLARVDHLITTHLHSDHYGGAPELAALVPVGVVHDNGIPEQDPDGRQDPTWPTRIRAYREMKVAERRVVRAGQEVALRLGPAGSPACKLRFLVAKQQFAEASPRPSAGAPCFDARPQPKDTSDNANSVVVLLEFGGFRFFDGGDLTWNVEAELVCPHPRVGAVDVYQVNHHGLDVSNNPLLLKALSPRVAVFNNGPRKGCAPSVVESLRLLPNPPEIFQVHRNQADAGANTRAERIANADPEGGRFLQLSVSPDARRYTVSVPATGDRETFEVRDR